MHRTAVTATLCLLILAAFCLWMLGECASLTVKGFDPEAWLDRHGEEAEKVALRALEGEALDVIPRSPALRKLITRVYRDAVAFTVQSGFKETSKGLCYSRSGEPVSLAIGAEPPDRWEKVRGNWYFWVSD